MIQVSDFIAMFAASTPKTFLLKYKVAVFFIVTTLAHNCATKIDGYQIPAVCCTLCSVNVFGETGGDSLFYIQKCKIFIRHAKDNENLQCGEQQYPYGNVGTRNVHITHLIPDIRNPYSPVARSPHTVQKEPGDGSVQHYRALHHHERAYHRTAYR